MADDDFSGHPGCAPWDPYELPADLRQAEPRPLPRLIEDAGPHEYVPYTRAMALLRDRLDATPHEVAAWVYLSPQCGGLPAYEGADELTKPPRFYFSLSGDDGDAYLDELASAWFRLDELERFAPADRYITGAELRARWSHLPGLYGFSTDAWIREKIRESRLLDMSPRTGLSQWSGGDKPWMTSREAALFSLAHVEAIEREDRLEPGLRREPRADTASSPEPPKRTKNAEARRDENLRAAREAIDRFPEECRKKGKLEARLIAAAVIDHERSLYEKTERGMPPCHRNLTDLIKQEIIEPLNAKAE